MIIVTENGSIYNIIYDEKKDEWNPYLEYTGKKQTTVLYASEKKIIPGETMTIIKSALRMVQIELDKIKL